MNIYFEGEEKLSVLEVIKSRVEPALDYVRLYIDSSGVLVLEVTEHQLHQLLRGLAVVDYNAMESIRSRLQ